jgi:branched-chain amino acid transport system ATP-binding protein
MAVPSETVLSVRDLEVRYGAITALNGVSFDVRRGEIFAVLGANGAGKTTLVRSIVGLTPIASGAIVSGDTVLTKLSAFQVARRGFSVVPEGGGTFPNLSVEDNLVVGPVARRLAQTVRSERLNAVYDRFPKLSDRRSQKAGTLSGGERQMLGIARTLMVDSTVLLLDEPSLGLAPLIVKQTFELLSDLSSEGYTILLVEQNARRALELATDALVLERGVVRLQGEAGDVLHHGEIADLYLGSRSPNDRITT